MTPFVNFLRFFSLADDGVAFAGAQDAPDSPHSALPAVAGDTLRFLLAPGDITPSANMPQVRLLNPRTGAVSPDPIGRVRRQNAEYYSELTIRVNSAPGLGNYRQFALLADVPNPAYQEKNIALGQPVTVSNAYPGLPGELLTNGVTTLFWSSNSNLLLQHEEWAYVELAVPSFCKRVRLSPRSMTDSYGFPIDFLIEVSSDGVGWDSVVSVINYPDKTGYREFTLPVGTKAKYVRVRGTKLRIGNSGDEYYRMQLSEIEVYGAPLTVPERITVNLLGTFRQQVSSLEGYVTAIREHFEGYAYTPVVVSQDDNELTLRIYHSEKFQLGNVPVYVGLGVVTEYNTNNPALTPRKASTQTRPAQDRYRVQIGDDIEAGNTFFLAGIQYVAQSGDKAADVLQGLGVPGAVLTLSTGQGAGVAVDPGTFSLSNTNKPSMQLLYDTTSSGADLYKAVIGSSVQEGNVYQVSATGMSTRSKVATASDTKASLEAFFNNTNGKLSVPSGAVPGVTVLAGARTLANTNRPQITLSDKEQISSQVIDTYNVYVNSSIRPGNVYTLGTTTITAQDGDTVLSIATKLGGGGHPILMQVPTGATLTAFAKKGFRYESSNIADVSVVRGAVHRTGMPPVCELRLPGGLTPGRYQLALTDDAGSVNAKSNFIDVIDDTSDTSLIRYTDEGSVFGYEYGEPGLVQQLRLPITLRLQKPRQSETLSRTLDGQTLRGAAQAELVRKLVTRARPESFHLALYAALKHQFVWVDNVAYRCEGDYQQSDPVGPSQLMQGTASLYPQRGLYRNHSVADMRRAEADALGVVIVDSVEGLPGADLFLKADVTGTITPVVAGQFITAGVYRLLVRAAEEVILAVYVDGRLAVQNRLTGGVLSRIDAYLLLDGGSSVVIVAQAAEADPGAETMTPSAYFVSPTSRPFSDEFGPAFT